jgi:hypothetical protein
LRQRHSKNQKNHSSDNEKFCTFAKILEMRKEIGKWFMDVAKYVATAILISSFLGSFEQKWAIYIVGTIIVAVAFFLGLFFIKQKK